MAQLRLALNGRITDHHRFLLGELMDDLETVEAKMQRIQKEIAQLVDLRKRRGAPRAKETAFLCRHSAKQGVRKLL